MPDIESGPNPADPAFAAAPQPAPAPEPEPAPAPVAEAALPVPDLDKIGSAKTATFVCVKRARSGDYTDAIFDQLRRQFVIPAAASKAQSFKLDDVEMVAFSFPTNPGFIEYDALTAYLARALN